jgi:hypothetical protein
MLQGMLKAEREPALAHDRLKPERANSQLRRLGNEEDTF